MPGDLFHSLTGLASRLNHSVLNNKTMGPWAEFPFPIFGEKQDVCPRYSRLSAYLSVIMNLRDNQSCPHCEIGSDCFPSCFKEYSLHAVCRAMLPLWFILWFGEARVCNLSPNAGRKASTASGWLLLSSLQAVSNTP